RVVRLVWRQERRSGGRPARVGPVLRRSPQARLRRPGLETEKSRPVVFRLPAIDEVVAGYRPRGIIGSSRCDGRAASTKTMVAARLGCSIDPSGSPELGLMSKCGKLLPARSSRSRWPRLNRLAQGNIATVTA